MLNSFQKNHLLKALQHFELEGTPLDLFLAGYFRAHKAVGAKDRRAICETIYGLIRWRGLLDHFLPPPPCWENRLSLFSTIDPPSYVSREEIPLHIRASFPKDFFYILTEAHGEKGALELCLINNTPAPTTVRINALKTTRAALLEKWRDRYPVSPCLISPQGIIFHKRINFFGLEEFKEGLFEIQDEGSQLLADLVDVKPGDHILDYCAGSGGKTLAFAPKTEKKGQIYLHDIRPRALYEARKRLKRAGIQNAQLLFPDSPTKNRLKNHMDWVLIDVPCSGSGTLRRNPDMKWRFNREMLDRLVEEQRKIFAEAIQFLKPKGRIVYTTCSILPQENQEQVAFFERQFPVKLEKPSFLSHPQRGGMDGFFGAVFSKSCYSQVHVDEPRP